MLTILNELSKVRDEQTGTFDFGALKIVYIAPMKALVQDDQQVLKSLEPFRCQSWRT